MLVGHDYTNHIDPSDYHKRRYNNDNSYGDGFNKKSRSNKDKDNKDNKPKDKIYTIRNNNSGNVNINIAVAKLNIRAYFINLLFNAKP